MASMFGQSSGARAAPAPVMQPAQPAQMDRSEPVDDRPKHLKKVSFAQFDPSAQQQINSMFNSPMFQELEAQVKANTDILDRMNKQMEDERKERIKAKQTAHIPEALKGSGQEMPSIMKTVEDLILMDEEVEEDDEEEKDVENGQEAEEGDDEEDEDEDEEEDDEDDDEYRRRTPLNKLQILDSHSKAALTGHSLAAYVSTLDEDNLKKFTSKITQDCQLWLSRLFRFPDSSPFYHEEHKDGLVKICRMALYQKYPRYPVEGFEALYSRPPVIYISSAAMPGLSNYLCLQLGLPLSSICNVPCCTEKGTTSIMDVQMLEKLIQDDISAAKTPVLLVGFAGSPHLGSVDNLQELRKICKDHKIWLHVEGNNLAILATVSVPTAVEPATSGDSMTLRLGKWIGIPGLPFITLYKTTDPALELAAGLNTFTPQLKLNCLPLWIILQSLGHDGIVDRIKHCCTLAEKMHDILQNLPTIKEIGEEKTEEKEAKTFKDLLFVAIDALFVFKMASPTVVFRYVEDSTTGAVEIAPYSPVTSQEDMEEKEKLKAYYDALNLWLCDTLYLENPNVGLELIDVEQEGNCIKFSPLDTAQVKGTVEEDIENFGESLKKQIAILDATVLQRDRFCAIVEAQDNLRIVEVPNWAGLGVVQYMPEEWRERMTDLPDNAKRDINNINTELVKRLHSKDTAFSLGYNDENIGCVKFGLITDDTDLEELIGLVCSLGKEIEESSKYLEKLSEKIQKGIEEANKELHKEMDEKLQQEGVLRQVPLVGSLLNWWSPPPKDAVKGRTFSLSSGTMASTEKTYKYHMQVQEDDAPPPVSPSANQSPNSFKDVLKPSSSPSSTQTDQKPKETQSLENQQAPDLK
ncbi:putative pyridoxal-dependent decarboxylase domain-containing protein 2 isoform X2 [Saccostrea echinata]|uniref:putative pyridoxal-dependent decarboxylase domain-containing protein 2 isoform X2 n=1 Tax=Saccostrea echinata TaxID=191078 RepID=UPI002A82CA10|nr:putative pyridoxal-dependent decarboxylase domain-containing protein 2 isoform X2 [Saccostrea echinata]